MTAAPPAKITLKEARRIALAAQGFSDARRSGEVTRRRLHQVIDQLGLLQIDSVNVLTRMHYLPLFSRLGDYSRAHLDQSAWGAPKERRLFEYWAHEASLLPLHAHPLFRWRMERAQRGEGVWKRLVPFAQEQRAAAETLLKRIEQEGPTAASDLEGQKGSGGWWGWSDGKSALEWLFWTGQIAAQTRRRSFERVYDVTERVLPQAVLQTPTPTTADAHRSLLLRSAEALGVATTKDLRDYFRLSPDDAKPRIAELVESGALLTASVEGWAQPAILHPDALRPRWIRSQALLAPFDPLIWERSRTERLFAVRYRIEIYTPADRREHGYYVLPFLMDEALVARVDLKADRAVKTLRVLAAYAEPEAPKATAERLAEELQLMARWLDLERVVVEPIGDLALLLTGALRLQGEA